MRDVRSRATLGAVALLFLAAGCGSAGALGTPGPPVVNDVHAGHNAADAAGLLDPVEFRQDVRKLWEDHVTWTRLFIVSAVAGLPDVDVTEGRLLQNQADIGTAMAAFYGDDAGAELTELLRQHILVAADLIAAAKAGDDAAIADERRRWYANAKDIADFLADVNPAWSKRELRQMMRRHLDQTLAEATARLTGDWAADVAEYDRIHLHILAMADVLAFGVIDQFPDRFGT
jgi:hypothetical protein